MPEWDPKNKAEVVHTFSNQIMAAVLDGTEDTFFDIFESFLQQIARKNFEAGYERGKQDAGEGSG